MNRLFTWLSRHPVWEGFCVSLVWQLLAFLTMQAALYGIVFPLTSYVDMLLYFPGTIFAIFVQLIFPTPEVMKADTVMLTVLVTNFFILWGVATGLLNWHSRRTRADR